MPNRASRVFVTIILLLFFCSLLLISCATREQAIPADQSVQETNLKAAAPEQMTPPSAASEMTEPKADTSPNKGMQPATPVMAAAQTAGTAPGDVLDMETCLNIALNENPAIRNAAKSVESAQWAKKQAFTNYLPTFSATYGYTYMDEAPRQPAIDMGGFQIPARDVGTRDNYQFTATITQPLFTGFATTSAYRLSQLGLDVAEISKEQARMDLILQVKAAYYQVLRAQKDLVVAEQSVKQNEEHLKVAQSFFDVGMVPKNDVLQADVRLAEAKQNQTVAENRLVFSRASLNVILQRSMDAPLPLVDILRYRPYTRNLEECLALASNKRPEILITQKNIGMKEQEIRLTQADYYPTISVSYNHVKSGDDWMVEGDTYHEGSAWNVAAVANWKVFEWGRTYDGVQKARVERDKSLNSLIQVKDSVRLEVKQNYLNMQAAEKNIAVSEKAVTQAEENYRMAQERYQEQVATYTEVTDAETLLTSARNQYNQALYEYNLSWASLERAMGLMTY